MNKQLSDKINILRKAYDDLPNAVGITDLKGRICYVNNAYVNMFEYNDSAKLTDKAIMDIIDNRKLERMLEIINKKGNWKGDTVAYKESGEAFYIQITCSSIYSEENKMQIGMLLTIINISEYKNSEIQLKNALNEQKTINDSLLKINQEFNTSSEENKPDRDLRKFIEMASDAIFIILPENGNFIDCNGAACKTLGYSKEELLELSVFDIDPQIPDINSWLEFVENMKLMGKVSLQTEHTRKNGTKFFVEINGSYIDDAKDIIIAIARDVSDRKNAELLLKEVGKIAKIGGWEMDIQNNGKSRWTQGTYDIVEIGYDEPIPGADEHINWYLPEYREMVANKMNELIATGKAISYEAQFKTKKGNVKWGRAIGKSEIVNGKIVKIKGTFQDITDIKKLQDQELKTKRFLFDIINSIQDIFYVYDVNGKFILWNKSFQDITEYTDDEISQMHPTDFFTEDEGVKVGKAIQQVFTKGNATVKANIRTKSGKLIPYYFSGSMIDDNKGNPILCGIAKDITELIEIKKELQNTIEEQEATNEELKKANDELYSAYNAIKDNQNNIIKLNEMQEYLLSTESHSDKLKKITDSFVDIFNAYFARIWLIRPADRCDKGCPHADITEGPHVCKNRDYCLHLVSSSGFYTHTAGGVHERVPFGCYKIGKIASEYYPSFLTNDAVNDERVHNHNWVKEHNLKSFAGFRLGLSSGKTLGVLAFFSQNEVSENDFYLAENFANIVTKTIILYEHEDNLKIFKKFMDSSSQGFGLAGPDTKTIYINDTLRKIVGLENIDDIVGKSFFPYIPEDMHNKIQNEVFPTLLKEGSWKGELALKNNDLVIPTEENYFVIKDEQGEIQFFADIVTDITERKKAEKTLMQDQRLKSMGELSAGISHDFNNALQSIITRSEIILSQGRLNEIVTKHAESIRGIAENASVRIRQLLQFTGRSGLKSSMEPLNVNEILSETIDQILPLKNEIEFKTNAKVNIDWSPGRIKNVLGVKGDLHAAFYNIMKNSLEALSIGGNISIRTLQKNKSVCIIFSDNGCGMDQITASRAFEPFYTTKDSSSGTGVGLSGSYSTIKSIEGNMHISYTEPGKGTVLEVEIPAFCKTEDKKESRFAEQNNSNVSADILWVDDSRDVRELGALMLELCGYNVFTASSGFDALETLKTKLFDIIITDIGMPGMSGWILAKEIKKLYPKIKLVILSGWDFEISDDEMIEKGFSAVIRKPINKKHLDELIRKLMNSSE